MIKLRRYLAYYKKECIIGPLCKLFEAILELLVPLVMAGIIDNGVRNGDTAYIWRMGGLLVILATVSCIKGISGCGNKTAPRFVFAHQQVITRRVGQARHSVTYNTNHI